MAARSQCTLLRIRGPFCLQCGVTNVKALVQFARRSGKQLRIVGQAGRDHEMSGQSDLRGS